MEPKPLSLNKILGEETPDDIKLILEKSGFDTILSLEKIDENAISEIEEYFNGDPSMLKGTSYENTKHFKLKPGHKKFLIGLPSRVKYFRKQIHPENDSNKYSDFAFIFKELIDVAVANSGKEPNGVRYSDHIRYFATYIYLHCGRKCYETLCANLPLPKTSTICKYIYSTYMQ